MKSWNYQHLNKMHVLDNFRKVIIWMSPWKNDNGHERVDDFATKQFQIILIFLYWDEIYWYLSFPVVLNWKLHEAALKKINF